MSKPMILFLVAAASASFAANSAQARDSIRSSPFHRCVNAALAVKPGQVLEAELETDDGRQVYEVDILGKDGTRWELKCDLATIKIIKVEREDDDKDKRRAQPYSSTGQQGATPSAAGGPGAQLISPQPIFKVSEEKAKQIALGQYPGQLTQVVYEYANGRPAYEVHIRSAQGTRIEVEIDGITGEVLEVSEKPR